ncbi:his Kinase A (Phosphoacceptor) domain./Histidine kinase-DNA gyrase B-and HSP90-like ATPase [Coprococcus sp. CAG:782]|nr:his Kinase A (Phosphoacceptor) domain./Histidine kinase-DNA gyrase B-and HSP90-like ATPase [Coprococcus sp. CAG:782]
MVEQLRKKLTIFLASVIALILIVMASLLLRTVIQEYTNSSYASYSKDANLLYSYLEQSNSIDMSILNEYKANNINIDILRSGNAVMSTNSFKDNSSILALETPYNQPRYWDDYYSAINRGNSYRRFYTVSYNHIKYWNSYSVVNIGGTYYTVHTLFNNKIITNYKIKMSILFFVVTLAAILLLAVFSYFFIIKVLAPVKDAYEKQDLFIAVASHELKTPLTIVKSCLSGLSENNQSSEENDYITTATGECGRMTDMINNLLTFTDIKKSGKDNFKNSHPEDVLIDCYSRFEAVALQKELNFTVSLPEEPLPLISMDRDRMLQCLSILVDNAISCTSAGQITLSVSLCDTHLCYRVADTGHGISDEDRPHIFETFYHRRNTPATHFGLGLSIAKSIADLHNAELTVADNEPQGSVFTIMFRDGR